MLVKCLHGYYMFEETKVGQVSDFMALTKLELVPRGTYFTFPALASIENYSIRGKMIGSVPAKHTFEGEPWEVFEKNGVVYDVMTGLIVPIDSIVLNTKVGRAGNRFTANGMLIAGAFDQNRQKIKSYSGWFLRDRSNWLYTEVRYV